MKIDNTKRSIANRFGVTDRCVDNWRKAGKLPPPLKLGTSQQARVRWTDEAVAQLEAALRADSAA